MYYAIESNATIIKLVNRAAALAFVQKGISASTEIYKMPNGWRAPKRVEPEIMASIILSQGKAMDIHFNG